MALSFGQTKQAFNILTLKNILLGDLNDAYKYMNLYFAKFSNGKILQWNPMTNSHAEIETGDLGKLLVSVTTTEIEEVVKGKIKSTKEKKSFFCNQWLEATTDLISVIICEHGKPRVFEDETTKALILNTFKGVKWADRDIQEFDTFDNKIKRAVRKWWKYIKEVICSNNEEQFEFLKNWLICTVNGVKCDAFTWFQGPQGAGKSFFWDFLIKYVLGDNAVLKTNDYHILLPGQFNTIIEGRLLIVLEELGEADVMKLLSEQLNQAIKAFTAQETWTIKTKYQSDRPFTNCTNLAFNTNNNSFRSRITDRRHNVPDVSDKYVGNKDYFADLVKTCWNDDVGYAFYCYCVETYESWDEDERRTVQHALPPITKARIEKNIVALESWKRFLRDEYILTKTDFDCRATELYDNYVAYCKHPSRNMFVLQYVSLIGKTHMGVLIYDKGTTKKQICKKRGKGNVTYLEASWEDLYEYAQENYWLNDDDVPENEEDEANAIEADDIETLCKKEKELRRALRIIEDKKRAYNANKP